MKKSIYGLVFASFCALAHPASYAVDAVNMQHMSGAHDKNSAIKHVMKAQFDQPNNPLLVNPIAVEQQYALAGWIQGGKGGRALLQLEHGHWVIAVCAGDALLKESTLIQTGMTVEMARNLIHQIKFLESKLDAETRTKLSSFDGLVQVNGSGHGHQVSGHAKTAH